MDYTDKNYHTDHDDCDCIAFVCMVVTSGPGLVDSDIQHCDHCGTEVWSSKGQRAAARVDYPNAPFLFRCVPCFILHSPKGKVDQELSIKWAKQGGSL